LSNCSHKLRFAVALNVVDFLDVNGAIPRSKASISARSVRVVNLKADTAIVLNIVHAVVWPAAIAAE